jgi:thymidylate synthase (FAD)
VTDKIDVLDHGYVRYVKHMGDDLDVVNSAKVSFDKESGTFEDKEARLLGFLAREEHTSVFRHSAVTLEVYAPLMVARQWWKYAVASSHVEDQLGWNESSRRYITEEPTFYLPKKNEWRTAPDNKKQGSGEPLPDSEGIIWTQELHDYIWDGVVKYEKAMEAGICAEQARLFLPAYGLYVRWRWTASLGSVIHFLHQRLEHDAQKEIQLYSRAVRDLLAGHFPVTVGVTVGS